MNDFYLDRAIEGHSKEDPKIIKDCIWCEKPTEARRQMWPDTDNTACDECHYPHTSDLRVIVEFLESKVCYLENYQIGPRRKLEKSHWEQLFGEIFDWQGGGLIPRELTRAKILDRLIEVVALLNAKK